jgi:DNA polymerase-3 subunit epsilon
MGIIDWIKNKFSHSNQVAKFPDFVQDYLQIFDKKIDYNTPIEETWFVILDTETTGLNVDKDEIISIGTVKLFDKSIDLFESKSLYLSDRTVHNYEAISIHGTMPNEGEVINEFEVLKILLPYLNSCIIVGHYISFDITMINKLLKKYDLPKLKNQIIDTNTLMKRIENPVSYAQSSGNVNSYSLDELCLRLDIETKQRHTAAGDAFLTAIVFIKLLEILKKRGITNTKQLIT